MPHPQPLPLPRRQHLRRLDRTLDLPSIQLNRAQLIQVRSADIAFLFGKTHDEVGPDLAAGGLGEDFVVEGDVDAGFEGGVEGFDAVGGQEHDAFVVFEEAEEDWVEGLAGL